MSRHMYLSRHTGIFVVLFMITYKLKLNDCQLKVSEDLVFIQPQLLTLEFLIMTTHPSLSLDPMEKRSFRQQCNCMSYTRNYCTCAAKSNNVFTANYTTPQ